MPAADEGCRVLLADGRALRARAVAYCVNGRAPLVPAWARPWLGAPLAPCISAAQHADPDPQSLAAPGAPSNGLAGDEKRANGAGAQLRRSAAAPAQCGPTGGAQRANEKVAPCGGAAAGPAGSGEAGMLQLAGAVDVRAPSTAAAVAGRSVAVVGGGMTAAALALAAARLGAARVVLLARAALVVQEFECEVRRSGPAGRRDEHGTAAAPSVAIMHLPLMLRHSRPDLSESRFDLPSVQVLCMCAFVAPGRTRPQRALVRAFLPAHFHAAACQVGWYGSKRLAAYAREANPRARLRAARGARPQASIDVPTAQALQVPWRMPVSMRLSGVAS